MSARSLIAVLGTLCLPQAGWAQDDAFGLGDGHLGALSVRDAGTVVNAYASITSPIQPGSMSISVSDASLFSAQDLVMLWQPTGLTPVVASGNPGPFPLGGGRVGRWELARVVSVGPGVVGTSAPLTSSYDALLSQLIRVPEYTHLSVFPGASVVAAPWNGMTGGVVALLATGTVQVGGTISADGAGFRGGAYVQDAPINPWRLGCVTLDEASPAGGLKGEGVCAGCLWPMGAGRGNQANGAGGGDCHNAGGGGGGHAAPGGQGGRSAWVDNDRDVGGLGGAPIEYSAMDRLVMGGGGGAAHGNDASSGGKGGAGGGVVFLRARQLLGSGSITASGMAGSSSTPVADGAGGGGAGGAIYLRCAGSLSIASIGVRGGAGGNAGFERHGPGGGGSGGRVLLQGAGAENVTVDVSGGLAGRVPPFADGGGYTVYGPSNGATPSSAMALFSGTAHILPGTLNIPSPDDRAPETTIVSGPPALTAASDAVFELAADEPDAGFQCKLDAERLFTPCQALARYAGLEQGLHTFAVSAVDAAGNVDASPARYQWKVDPGAFTGKNWRVGCGCDSSGAFSLGALVSLWVCWLWLRRRPSRS